MPFLHKKIAALRIYHKRTGAKQVLLWKFLLLYNTSCLKRACISPKRPSDGFGCISFFACMPAIAFHSIHIATTTLCAVDKSCLNSCAEIGWKKETAHTSSWCKVSLIAWRKRAVLPKIARLHKKNLGARHRAQSVPSKASFLNKEFFELLKCSICIHTDTRYYLDLCLPMVAGSAPTCIELCKDFNMTKHMSEIANPIPKPSTLLTWVVQLCNCHCFK